MPEYLTSPAIWEALWPVPLTAVLVALLLMLAYKPRNTFRKYFVILLSFSLLGLVTGLLAGLSREAAMGAVLPAVLSLVGGLAIYLVGSEKVDQGLVGVCIIALSLDLLVGTIWGSDLRDVYEREAKSAVAQKRNALTEVEVRDFRRDLGLSESPPSVLVKKEAN